MTDSTNLTRRAALGLLGGALALPPLARVSHAQTVAEIEALQPGQFTWHPERSPKGGVAVVVSIPEQKVHVYRNGVRIGVSTCSTGKPGHETPTGVFTILQKDKHHRSSTYGGAPMPNMNRLTWDGVALHAGNLPGYPASHGCVRLPMAFSERLFGVTHIGTPVIIAGSHTDPWSLIHPGLLLGNDPHARLQAAVDGLNAKSHPSDWSETEASRVTTLLVTGADRRAVLIENGTDIAESGIVIEGPPVLGEHVLMLEAAEGGGTRWTGLTHHPDPARPEAPEANVLNRVHPSKEFNARLHAYVHPGMMVIVSDLPATPDRRTGQDFVILSA
jgi:hypothetical protein